MARTRQRQQQEQENEGKEWSCPLCTLANDWRDDRCMACDNARPAMQHPIEAPSPALPTAAAIGANSLQHAADDFSISVSSAIDAGLTRSKEGGLEVEKKEATVDVEEPSFNLLGPVLTTFPPLDNRSTPASNERAEEPALAPPLRHTDFIPASKVHVEEPVIDAKLARAGLDLSDSDDDKDAATPRRLRRRREAGKSTSPRPKWECGVCTNLNVYGATQCQLCSCARSPAPVAAKAPSAPDLTWACRVCTNLNPSGNTRCEACDCERTRGSRSSDEKWACSMCTSLNPSRYTHCEMCNSKRTGEGGDSQESRQCPVCTNYNLPGSTRCELCDSPLQAGEAASDRVVDLVSSSQGRTVPPSSDVGWASPRSDESPRRNENGTIGSADAPSWARDSREKVSNKTRLPEESGFRTRRAASVGNPETTASMRAASPPRPVIALDHSEDEEHQRMEDDSEEEVEEPCFNLLGSDITIFPPSNGQSVSGATSNERVSPTDTLVRPPSPPTGFTLVSEPHVEELAMDAQLASAGLNLTESDEDEYDTEPRRLRHRGEAGTSTPPKPKWECGVCTNLNAHGATECELCKCTRTTAKAGTSSSPDLAWTCHVCTNLNPPGGTHCESCDCSRAIGTSSLNEEWACLVCTSVNPPGGTRCELCNSERVDASKRGMADSSSQNKRWACSACATYNPPGGTHCETCNSKRTGAQEASHRSRECPVCTNLNPPSSTRCEICDSPLQAGGAPSDRVIDLVSSSQGFPTSTASVYTNDESDLENPYADLSQYDDYDSVQDEPADLDFVEDISDNEAILAPNNGSRNVRADLKEFELFTCMEDLRGDYGCRINYHSMFAGNRTGKSYADRLVKRQEESQKRKRQANARAGAGGSTPPIFRRGKASKAGAKKKKAAAPRRGSAGAKKAAKGKRGKKKCGAPVRRTSAPTTYSSGINHYGTSSADLGEEISTMAWEGVGSAGYF